MFCMVTIINNMVLPFFKSWIHNFKIRLTYGEMFKHALLKLYKYEWWKLRGVMRETHSLTLPVAMKIKKIYKPICHHVLSITKLNPFNPTVIYGNYYKAK